MAELTEYEEVRLKEIFELLDLDNSGSVDASELRTGCQLFGLNPSTEEIAEVNAKPEKRGSLNYEEFTALVLKLNKPDEELKNDLNVALCVIMEDFGLNEDDRISREQFKSILQVRGDDPMTEEEIDEVFHDIDTDGDTEPVTREELIQLFSTEF